MFLQTRGLSVRYGAEIGIADLADRRISKMSGGQRQLVMIAQVLAAHPVVRT
ncbi:ATP-binding cassette domain-containing protein [Limobrevibacterium gyesilva]|uniref:ABC transporter domain-containing protein n=1 Tax=Limobrevibacterium gyesilva TaxID=2991712 RepID=A0AA42CJW3_9PROT|nr:ATP-binding cassette domain-containing protein [Limobrevibacterium gyesilva]MCW3477302.1 hypothetical protein [Limobrevibacterium gyesilva]